MTAQHWFYCALWAWESSYSILLCHFLAISYFNDTFCLNRCTCLHAFKQQYFFEAFQGFARGECVAWIFAGGGVDKEHLRCGRLKLQFCLKVCLQGCHSKLPRMCTPSQPKMQNLTGCQECATAAQNAKSPRLPRMHQCIPKCKISQGSLQRSRIWRNPMVCCFLMDLGWAWFWRFLCNLS